MKLLNLAFIMVPILPAISIFFGSSFADLDHYKLRLNANEDLLMHHQPRRMMASTSRHQLLHINNHGERVQITSFNDQFAKVNGGEDGGGNSKSEYHGNDLNFHHTIDPQYWSQMHTPPPDN
ncbi:hypothetical protein Cni_G14554 [Canna indica]|uniref:Uncharacterized protein n=1 Tax=Canna indica TaxID=4628 RepID=A0AAQ3KBP1_9LILI|nr:hypothetical protein Cni_G14554 [Canna indica]